jgi:hypothetical protein
MRSLVPSPLQHVMDGLQPYMPRSLSAKNSRTSILRTFVQVFKGRSERKTDEMVARTMEEIPSVGRIDIEEDARNDDSVFFQ